MSICRTGLARAAAWLAMLPATAGLMSCTGPAHRPDGSDPVRPSASPTTRPYVIPKGIHKIRHVIVIMQENRSFDSFFGTYPRADGIPMRGRTPAVCVPNPAPAS